MPRETVTETATVDSLADLTHRDLIVPCLEERDAAGVIGELSRRLGRMNCVSDALSFYQEVLNLKLLCDFAAPPGIALAHARMNGIARLRFAFGRARPISWNAKGSGRVEFIFLLAVPPAETDRYLQLLSSLAALGRCPREIAQMRQAANANEILAVFEKTPLAKRIASGFYNPCLVS
jgi:mannitol/fructose-specific phosphotransferase system IIA component (Ntr-type)